MIFIVKLVTCTARKHSRGGELPVAGDSSYDLELSLKSNPMSTLNIGFRFDSEDMAGHLVEHDFTNRSYGVKGGVNPRH